MLFFFPLSLLTLLHRASHPPRFTCVRWRQHVAVQNIARACVTTVRRRCSDWWESLVVSRMRLLNAFVYVMAASTRTASVFIRMTKIVDKKKKSRCVKCFFFLRLIWNSAENMHHIFILRIIHADFETKGVLFMVMPNPFFQGSAVKSFIYYNAPLNMLSTGLSDVTCFRSQRTGNCIVVEGV